MEKAGPVRALELTTDEYCETVVFRVCDWQSWADGEAVTAIHALFFVDGYGFLLRVWTDSTYRASCNKVRDFAGVSNLFVDNARYSSVHTYEGNVGAVYSAAHVEAASMEIFR